LESSNRFLEVREKLGAHGIQISEAKLDLPVMLRRKDQIVTTLTRGVEALFKKNKIDGIHGTARIAAPGKVEVTGADGQTQTLETRSIVIATGSDVARLKGIEIDERRVVSSTGALSLDRVPQRLVVVGAGVIGLELGSMWRRLLYSVKFGSRPRIDLMRSYSSGVRPCLAINSGVMAGSFMDFESRA
jgi:dihydrolipoamide dehydrogenase